MTNQVIPTDFDLLSTAANFIRTDFVEENDHWNDSPFQWILHLPAGSKGKLGKQLVDQWCALKGLTVNRSPDSEADTLVNGHRVEVKFSTLWKGGMYKFQQIRNQNYELVVCLGISPHTAHCWVISKDILLENVIGHLGQHTGATGTETSWITVYPNRPPNWLIPCGGTLEQAYQILRNYRRRN